jgi:hypothetical protein
MAVMDRIARRRVLMGAVAAVAGALAAGAASAVRRSAAALRPGARGTSVTCCARCGGADHGMLDVRCPASPEVW